MFQRHMGKPIRDTLLPYGRQSIDEKDVQSVVDVLRSDWLTTGPMVETFEQEIARFVGARFAVAVSSGTAALHAAMNAISIGPGDEVILPPMTFCATANAVLFCGGTPVFADVDANTLLIDPHDVEAKITPQTKAIVPVDYAGQPCDYDALHTIAERHSIPLITDACHSLGAEYKGKQVGTLADVTVFSFHPVKHITSGEGGMVVTDDPELAANVRRFRNHGIAMEHWQRAERGTWYYEMTDLGFNYRITDFQCALGLSQLQKLPLWIKRRREIAQYYDGVFYQNSVIHPLSRRADVSHAYHLYVTRLEIEQLHTTRAKVFTSLRDEGIGVNVHYIPVHLHPYYKERFNTGPGLCPVAEAAYESIISLPMFHGMTDEDAEDVVSAMRTIVSRYQ